MKIDTKKFFRIPLIILFALCFGLSFIAFFSAKNVALADTAYERFLPTTTLENVGLSSPTHAYADDEITAITTAITPTNNKLLISLSGDTPIELNFANQLGQIYRFNKYLLYRENLTIHAINIYDTSENLSLSYIDSENHSQSFNCNYCGFWDNGETLAVVVCLENAIQIFNINEDYNGQPTVNLSSLFIDYPKTIKKAPVAINSTSVFFISPSNVLYRTNINTMESVPYSVINPTAMVANDDYVYCITDNQIYRFSAKDNQKSPTILTAESDYELGKPSTPVDIAFKNDNLLITDGSANGSVQEFKINGDTLEFTGYAIASGLSAYNRVAANATNIERYGKFVAALDGNKLTVIDTENCTDYNTNAFINKFVGNAPDKFALGNGTILYSKGTSVYLTDVLEDNAKQITGLPNDINPNDITYQSGKYYIAYLDIGTNSKIVKIGENGEILSETNFNGVAANKIAVDVFNNVYVADSDNVYKNEVANFYPLAGAQKLATDLAGTLFALSSDGKIYKLDETTSTFTVAVEITGKTIKTFGMDFDRKEIYFLLSGEEQIYYTNAAGNVSLEDVTPLIAERYNAAITSKKELSVYTANDGAKVYSVVKSDDKFVFNGLIEKAAEYPLIAEIPYGNFTMCVLACESGVVLINKENDLTPKTVEQATVVDGVINAFLTTSVHAYAVPVIEKNGLFIMDKGAGKIKLDKGATVTADGVFILLNKVFYHATAKINGEDIACYIPADFTATVLSENFEFENYTVEKVKKTVLYQNADLTEELFELIDGETVKLLENKDGMLKVAVTREEGTFIGYIAENSLIVNPSAIVRNVLIILAVFGSLAGTVSYFLLRKKR
ncbi:MAG: hypothetical protein IJQ23_06245 [Clostridia bacterium]|nr:hypothetical protein [Clostridia bacterium]